MLISHPHTKKHSTVQICYLGLSSLAQEKIPGGLFMHSLIFFAYHKWLYHQWAVTPILLFFFFFLSFSAHLNGHSISVKFSSDCFHASTSRLTVSHRRAAHIHYLKMFWFASLIDISSLQTGEQGRTNNLHVDTSVLYIVHKGGRWQPMMRKER